MAKIEVQETKTGLFTVTVEDRSVTTHAVTLTEDYYQKLTGGRVPPERLIQASFEFLLERESNTMILSRFALPVIGQYFPEYERAIGKRL